MEVWSRTGGGMNSRWMFEGDVDDGGTLLGYRADRRDGAFGGKMAINTLGLVVIYRSIFSNRGLDGLCYRYRIN